MTVLDGLELERELGRGTSCTVWRARLGGPVPRTVAVKRPRVPDDARAADRLRREARLLAGLDHPHVVRLLAVHDDGGAGVALVLPVAEGGSLGDLLAARGRLPADEARGIVLALADALGSLHARGIVHRDVAPANVLLTADGAPLLADLGAAVVAGDATPAPTGTPGYVDPAVLAGHPPTPATDVHGLAAVAHHLLAGAPPFPGDDDSAVLAAARGGRRVPLDVAAPGVAPALARCLDAALDPDPARRPADGAAFAAALRRAWTTDAPTATAPAPSPQPRPRRGPSRPGRTREFAPAPRGEAAPAAGASPRTRSHVGAWVGGALGWGLLVAELAATPPAVGSRLLLLHAPVATLAGAAWLVRTGRDRRGASAGPPARRASTAPPRRGS